MRAAARALPALEVAVRRGGAPLARPQDVGIHAETHRAARVAPLESRVREDAVEPLSFGVGLHTHRSRHDESADARAHVPAANDLRGRPQILETCVRAGPDEHGVDRDLTHRGPWREVRAAERAAGPPTALRA